jgi:folate-binding protein YgfZ
MNEILLANYHQIHNNTFGYKKLPRGLFAVWGKEAVQFLNGLITNDVKNLTDNQTIIAAFPNAQGRLLGLVRVQCQGEKILFETEESTREKIFQNLFRFTFAGDFFVEDLSDKYNFYWISDSGFQVSSPQTIQFDNDIFVPKTENVDFTKEIEVSDELFEVLRIEKGIPLFGIDMDETTIVPEIGLENLISYNKGCYIGQEIIARIHFRGHIAKQLKGLILSEGNIKPDDEIKSLQGKNAGKITSVCYSPRLEKNIALGIVRYDYLADGTELLINESKTVVSKLPFFD